MAPFYPPKWTSFPPPLTRKGSHAHSRPEFDSGCEMWDQAPVTAPMRSALQPASMEAREGAEREPHSPVIGIGSSPSYPFGVRCIKNPFPFKPLQP